MMLRRMKRDDFGMVLDFAKEARDNQASVLDK